MLQRVHQQMDYLGQILRSGIPNTSPDGFIKPPHHAEPQRQRDPRICVQPLNSFPLSHVSHVSHVSYVSHVSPASCPAHSHRTWHRDGGTGQGTQPPTVGTPSWYDKEHVPAPGTRKGRRKRMGGGNIPSPPQHVGLGLF